MKLDRVAAAAPARRRPGLAVPAAAPVEPCEDTIFLRGIRVEALIGVYEHERHAPQPLVIDLELGLQHARCCASDDLRDAVDYGQVLAAVRRLAQVNQAVLLEAFAQNVADALLAGFELSSVAISVSKPAIFDAADSVGVSIRRRRASIAGAPA
ncbi:dihydroneopterin aldolase [Aromatoleum toluclasticum]|uniref:dihydroneopterin aldolase n=1 Tax=Aromatoleum toluclasticum TaxID=92003 RepID=UPI001E5C3405|nr:dihydroneopterin aldolase [Aromatoleum toluclasticum]